MSIPGYTTERKDQVGKRGGGHLVYINDDLPYLRRNDLETNDLEILWLEIRPLKSKAFLMGYIYRPPSTTTDIDTRRPIEHSINEVISLNMET